MMRERRRHWKTSPPLEEMKCRHMPGRSVSPLEDVASIGFTIFVVVLWWSDAGELHRIPLLACARFSNELKAPFEAKLLATCHAFSLFCELLNDA